MVGRCLVQPSPTHAPTHTHIAPTPSCSIPASRSCSLQPVMLFNPAKLPAVSRFMLHRGIAIVVVGFPATPLLTARTRVCISASHSKADLDYALEVFKELVDRSARAVHAALCILRRLMLAVKWPAVP